VIPWREAWQHALYGPGGFYRRPEGPAGHFTTATHGSLGPAFAEGVAALAAREGVCRVVDLACGRGELLAHLRRLGVDLELTGVDVVDRPASLPADVHWLRSPGGPDLPDELADLDDTLIVANEWLDVIPCTIAQVDDEGVGRVVLVDATTGEESLGDPIPEDDARWVAQWWPSAVAGERVEIGSTRDRAFAELVSRVRSGVVLAIDYGHTRAQRPTEGTLAAYREGVPTLPVPDGSCDLTVHVALDSLGADELTTQRDALRDVGLVAAPVPHDLASRDPSAYLEALARRSAVGALTDPRGLGGFGWALTRRGQGAVPRRAPRHTADSGA
jgi:SAM-dependent MidA family methyltransferase